jgi:hypothetical protein
MFRYSGNPHVTPRQNGHSDPFHGSGAIGGKKLKKDDRETSLYIYPNGVVKPTNEKWPTLQVTAATAQELGDDAVWLTRSTVRIMHREDIMQRQRPNISIVKRNVRAKTTIWRKAKVWRLPQAQKLVVMVGNEMTEWKLTRAGLRVMGHMCIGTRVLRLKNPEMGSTLYSKVLTLSLYFLGSQSAFYTLPISFF